jgi:hypothetical protein
MRRKGLEQAEKSKTRSNPVKSAGSFGLDDSPMCRCFACKRAISLPAENRGVAGSIPALAT